MYLREKYRHPESAYPRAARVTSGYRYYSPTLGRWLARDPIGEDGGINVYALVNADPINSVDPKGELPAVCAFAGCCFGVGGMSCVVMCALDPIWDDANDTLYVCIEKCILEVLPPGENAYSNFCWLSLVACGISVGILPSP